MSVVHGAKQMLNVTDVGFIVQSGLRDKENEEVNTFLPERFLIPGRAIPTKW